MNGSAPEAPPSLARLGGSARPARKSLTGSLSLRMTRATSLNLLHVNEGAAVTAPKVSQGPGRTPTLSSRAPVADRSFSGQCGSAWVQIQPGEKARMGAGSTWGRKSEPEGDPSSFPPAAHPEPEHQHPGPHAPHRPLAFTLPGHGQASPGSPVGSSTSPGPPWAERCMHGRSPFGGGRAPPPNSQRTVSQEWSSCCRPKGSQGGGASPPSLLP